MYSVCVDFNNLITPNDTSIPVSRHPMNTGEENSFSDGMLYIFYSVFVCYVQNTI